MNTAFYLVCILILLVAVYPVLHSVASTYLKFRGTNVITCPETQQPATVKVDATRAALKHLVGSQTVRLRGCSRWPGRRDCGQQCVGQLGLPSGPGVIL